VEWLQRDISAREGYLMAVLIAQIDLRGWAIPYMEEREETEKFERLKTMPFSSEESEDEQKKCW
jgi:hypothetical protein